MIRNGPAIQGGRWVKDILKDKSGEAELTTPEDVDEGSSPPMTRQPSSASSGIDTSRRSSDNEERKVKKARLA